MGRKEENKTKLRTDEDFIPPDGGWGWMIVFAAGFSNLSIFPLLQQFGLLFRDRFAWQGISSSETTTIINICSAMMYCVGLANGPLFKTFSYRQVALVGAVVIFVSIFCTIFSYNFASYLITISVLYGIGLGISGSANSLALNTYWKKRRRLATAFSWTTTGLGPIVWPQIITYLFVYFGEEGTLLLLAGFSLHAIFCALLLHPVEWHSKKPKEENDIEKLIDPDVNKALLTSEDQKETGYFRSQLNSLSAFSSQYLNNEDDPENTGYEITDPDIPMMVGPNSRYFSQQRLSKGRISLGEISDQTSRPPSKKVSMTNLSENNSRKSSTLCRNECKTDLYTNVETQEPNDCKKLSQNSNPRRRESIADNEVLTLVSQNLQNYLKEDKDPHLKLLAKSDLDESRFLGETKIVENDEDDDADKKLTLCQKVYRFFDLDLFKDFTFVNLMLGLTLITFSEINWSTLTPFILGDYGMTKQQVAFFMSLLAGVDICVRFCIPFVASKIGWDNSSFFLFGVILIAIGRIVLAYCQEYEVVILVAVIIGFGKGLRTVFMALVIPSHVPLHKLPGASGIHLLTSGIAFLALGPVVGYIKDNASTAVTLHCLNIFTFLTTISWGFEKYIRSRYNKKASE